MLAENRAVIERKCGRPVEITRIGVRDKEKARSAPDELFTTDLMQLVTDPQIDVVLELIGGMEPAQSLILKALESGKHVVTANKELIAKEGSHLLRTAAARGLDLHFEAAVGGGIPLIQPLKHQLAGNDVIRLMGIVNGTTNHILTQMSNLGKTFAEALEEAQSAGYAEADPTNDVEGYDAQFKAAILASIAFGADIGPKDVYRKGVTELEPRDIEVAGHLGLRVKLLAIAEEAEGTSNQQRGVRVRVHPTLLPLDHPLAAVSGVYNAVWLIGDFVGDVMLSGRGAGGAPTGSAVVGDLIDTIRNMELGGAGNLGTSENVATPVGMDGLMTRYFVRLIVRDEPMVLGRVATILGARGISISATEMTDLPPSQGEIVLLTHRCSESHFRAAWRDLQECEEVLRAASMIRVELPEKAEAPAAR